MSDVLKKDKLKEGVSVLTLNRPEVLNSLNKELVDSLLDAFNEIYEDNSIRSEGTYSTYASLDDKIDGFHYYTTFESSVIQKTCYRLENVSF